MGSADMVLSNGDSRRVEGSVAEVRDVVADDLHYDLVHHRLMGVENGDVVVRLTDLS